MARVVRRAEATNDRTSEQGHLRIVLQSIEGPWQSLTLLDSPFGRQAQLLVFPKGQGSLPVCASLYGLGAKMSDHPVRAPRFARPGPNGVAPLASMGPWGGSLGLRLPFSTSEVRAEAGDARTSAGRNLKNGRLKFLFPQDRKVQRREDRHRLRQRRDPRDR